MSFFVEAMLRYWVQTNFVPSKSSILRWRVVGQVSLKMAWLFQNWFYGVFCYGG